MTDGVTSPSAGNFNFVARISQTRADPGQNKSAEAADPSPTGPEPTPAPKGQAMADDATDLATDPLADYSLLDLAVRDFSRILPSIELLTNPVE